MELERDMLVSPAGEVPVIEGELVTAIRTMAGRGVGKKTIAREVGVAVNTVRRYLRQPIVAGQQVRPAARRLTDDRRMEAPTLYEGPAEANAVVVQRLLTERGCAVSVRTIERAVVDIRRARRVAALATVRVETGPGRPAADRLRPETSPHCRRARSGVSPGRRAQLLASTLRQSVSQ